jgi:hypothetical protein
MTAEIHMLRTTAVIDREAAVHTLEKMLQHGTCAGRGGCLDRCDWPRQCNLVRQRRRVVTRRSFITAISRPDLYGALSYFETMPSKPSLQMALNISTPSPSVYSMY